MNPWVATAICRAVYTAAETGKGTIQRVRADDPYRISIRVPGAIAYAQVDADALVLTVLRIMTTT